MGNMKCTNVTKPSSLVTSGLLNRLKTSYQATRMDIHFKQSDIGIQAAGRFTRNMPER